MTAQRSGPSRAGYLLATVVFILGTIGAVVLGILFIAGIFDLSDSLHRVVVPGTSRLELTETGRYTIYYEHRSRVDGTEYRTDEQRPQLNIEVTHVESGASVPVQSRDGLASYEVSGYAGTSLQGFRIDEPGTYEISADYPAGQSGPDVVLAIGEGIERTVFASVGALFGSGLLFCGATFIALLIVVITLVRRSRHEQQYSTPAT